MKLLFGPLIRQLRWLPPISIKFVTKNGNNKWQQFISEHSFTTGLYKFIAKEVFVSLFEAEFSVCSTMLVLLLVLTELSLQVAEKSGD